MNFITKNKWFAAALVILILLNMSTLAALWWMKNNRNLPGEPPQGGATAFLIKELKLDSAQQEKLKLYRDEHHKATQSARRANREAKEHFFRLLQNDTISEAEIQAAANTSVQYDIALTRNTFDHFKKIRSMCTATQKEKFDEIIQDVLRMMAAPPGPPPRGEGNMARPGAGGPPPPHEMHTPEN